MSSLPEPPTYNAAWDIKPCTPGDCQEYAEHTHCYATGCGECEESSDGLSECRSCEELACDQHSTQCGLCVTCFAAVTERGAA